MGQHRLQPGKSLGYEEDVNVPLVIRGPGVAKNRQTELVTDHTDISPTIIDLIGLPPRPDFDGVAIPVHAANLHKAETATQQRWHEHASIEYWGTAYFEGIYGSLISNNTFKAIRVIGRGYNLYYSVWCNNEHELYDMQKDPHQLNNLLLKPNSNVSLLGHPIAKVAARLDALMLVMKSCKGSESCTKPWNSLHPAGNVANLREAMNPRYDIFYDKEQVKVSYSECALGYLKEFEGPQFDIDGLVYRDGLPWDAWT